MPINIDNDLPAKKTLTEENIFVMTEERAIHQEIRPLEILILNLMPKKIETETQLLRLLGNSPIQVEIELIHPATHQSKNTSEEHLTKFYKTFKDVQGRKFDGLIITGAPVEQMEFDQVTYWDELCEIMDWAKHNVFSTLYLCWAAQAGLFHYYRVPKHLLAQKMFGVFPHKITKQNTKLLRGFDDLFYLPHSRHTTVIKEDVEKVSELETLAESPQAGVCIVGSKDGKHIFVTGHAEYDPLTLKEEYVRDVAKNLEIAVPINYFPGDDPSKQPMVTWRSHAHLLFANWLNYYVYQETPYHLEEIA